MTASARRSSARAVIRRCSPSPMSCARSRRAATCIRKPMWRTCTAPTASVAPPPVRSRWRSESTFVSWGTRHRQTLSTPSRLAGGRSLWRAVRLGLVAVSIAIVATLAAGAWWVASLGPAPLGEGLAFSTLVVDRDGKLLRPYTTPDGRWRLPAARENVDPRFLELLFAYEDRRFAAHLGVDPLALGRAFSQLVTHGRIVSGASTITMQVARLLEVRSGRSLTTKLRQIVRAIEIERALTKDEILALYLSLAPYGGNLEGVRAASLAYFGKEPRRLTLGEAALLVALPQSPEHRRPDRSSDAVRHARNRVLDRVAASGRVPADEIARAKQEPV